MTLDDFIFRFDSFFAFLADVLIFAFALKFYQRHALRSALLISISSAISALLIVLPWVVQESTLSTPGTWHLMKLMTIAANVLWLLGTGWLLREYDRKAPSQAD